MKKNPFTNIIVLPFILIFLFIAAGCGFIAAIFNYADQTGRK